MLPFAAVNDDLQLALELADLADAITMKHFRAASLSVRAKADRSPVTEADEAAERAIRGHLQRVRPSDGILGEEFGTSGSASRRWILDPIDGTANYMRGVPVFGTLIALEENDRIVAGVVSAPALSRRWYAARGGGAFCNGGRLSVSSVSQIGEAFVSTYSVEESFRALAKRCGRVRDFGDFWPHMLVAEGAIDIATDPVVAPWDMAPVQIIVEEAGGRFTDLRGNGRHDGGSGLSTNGALHDAALESFR
jgi:histidinol-phosphatase